ncbi:MAG TPA: DUF6089 family protein [Chitinophagaceae bacterium]|nr:DUF6089 family protein [Chitinophagaceae bacterium]
MRNIRILVFALLLANTVFAQRFHVGVFGGLAAYNGDLADKLFPRKVTNGAIGVTGNYELTENLMLRAGFTYAVLGGADRNSRNEELVSRNLSFETALREFSLLGEYYIQNLYDHRFSPYFFAGLAVFHYNPYTFNGTNDKVFLKPLSTEGQGIAGYTNKPYSLTQVAIPLGAGLKFALTNNLHIGAEVGLRKLFTDYLDDVSTNYADPADLLAAKGQTAVDLSYRGDEIDGGNPNYPSKGAQRGGSKYKDFYYFTGLHLTYRLGGSGGGGFLGGHGKKSRIDCPTNVY